MDKDAVVKLAEDLAVKHGKAFALDAGEQLALPVLDLVVKNANNALLTEGWLIVRPLVEVELKKLAS